MRRVSKYVCLEMKKPLVSEWLECEILVVSGMFFENLNTKFDIFQKGAICESYVHVWNVAAIGAQKSHSDLRIF